MVLHEQSLFLFFLAGFSTPFSKSKVLLAAWEGVFEEARPTSEHAGAECRKRSDSHPTNNLNWQASFLPGKTELLKYYLSSNITNLKSFDVESFTGRGYLVTTKLMVYIGGKHHPALAYFLSALFRVATLLQVRKGVLVLCLRQ